LQNRGGSRLLGNPNPQLVVLPCNRALFLFR
jgi:hypothetical protein